MGTSGPLSRVHDERPLALLPLVSFDRDRVLAQIEQPLHGSRHADRIVGEVLAPAAMLRMATYTQSVYWAELALRWVESSSVSDAEWDELLSLLEQPWITRHVRSRALRQLKRCDAD
ncbi:hypothetical protein [Nocardia sp. NPDC057668]|uniref:hypothetical protein n=1 Tax=Nocardia sp. NPDC057668 TaxID=3346202 RepID=UPI0036703879